jgi:DNA repair protein SbcD/Mre11
VQYVALGHLHRYQNIGSKERPAIYSSSPLQYSFSESGQEKCVVIIDALPNLPVNYKKVKLTKGRGLFRKKFESYELAVNWLHENPNTLVEITLMADDFLDPAHLRALHKEHDGIIHIIPEIKNLKDTSQTGVHIDLQKTTEQLFVDYFKHSKQQNPSDEIISLFREILNE